METATTLLWDEWTAYPVPHGYAAEAEIAGLCAGLGFAGNVAAAETLLSSRRLHVFRRLRRLWPSAFWAREHPFAEALQLPEEKKGQIHLRLSCSLSDCLRSRDAGVVSSEERWHWMRGFWGASGSLFSPRSGWYLVIRLVRSDREDNIRMLLEEAGGVSGGRLRGGKRELLLRNQETIAVFFARLGLSRTSLKVEERGLMRAMRDRANKLVNCDAANIRKSIEAAERHLALCRKIEEVRMLEMLPDDLRELVEKRLRHPSLSLQELGQTFSRPVSKSTVEYRWAKLKKATAHLD